MPELRRNSLTPTTVQYPTPTIMQFHAVSPSASLPLDAALHSDQSVGQRKPSQGQQHRVSPNQDGMTGAPCHRYSVCEHFVRRYQSGVRKHCLDDKISDTMHTCREWPRWQGTIQLPAPASYQRMGTPCSSHFYLHALCD